MEWNRRARRGRGAREQGGAHCPESRFRLPLPMVVLMCEEHSTTNTSQGENAQGPEHLHAHLQSSLLFPSHTDLYLTIASPQCYPA